MTISPSLSAILERGEPIRDHRPWLRAVVTTEIWSELVQGLAADGVFTLLGLWGEPETVHLAVYDAPASGFGIASLPCPEGHFPSVGRRHPPAQRLERTLADLVGLQAIANPDSRPWLDHGRWPVRHPLGSAQRGFSSASPYAFLPAEGESLHQIPVGPVHAGIIEPGHFRFTANGEAVVRLEERLGYVHKGIETLLRGASVERAARLAGRVSGDSTVAYALAFARAVEALTGVETPDRAHELRALMAELERLANHFGDIGAICNDAAFSLMHAHCGVLRERVLRASADCFGHRLLMDCVIPGGVATDLSAECVPLLRKLVGDLRRQFKPLIELYDNTASLQDRTVGTGFLKPELARRFGAGGYVGRASGRGFDARRTPGYPPYDRHRFEVPVLDAGDVDARVMIRIHEVAQSLALIEQILNSLTPGPIHIGLETSVRAGEGLALVEGFRGDILVWLRLADDGTVQRCHLRDPSWFQWPLLEAVIEGNIVADFPLCNKSFNCSYSGHDL
ncbi:MAG: hydrogenase expression protein HypE [Candidatus Competibacteraceae bacterium]